MRAVLTALALALSVTASGFAQTQASGEKALLIGRIDTLKAAGEGGLYDLDVIVLKVLSGKDPGEFAHVRLKADTAELEGKMITLLIDPDLKLGAPGQSWWAASNFPEPECVPKELVEGPAFRDFRAKSFELDGKRCVKL